MSVPTHKATAALAPPDIVCIEGRIALPRVLLLQAPPADHLGLVHARQASKLHSRQVTQQEEEFVMRKLCGLVLE